MSAAREAHLLPDPQQHDTLVATLERVNRASNAARAAVLERQPAPSAADVRTIVKEECERVGLPSAFVTPVVERVRESVSGPPGRRPRFSTYQSLVLPASALRWPSNDRVVLPTLAGRRTVRVRVERGGGGGLRPPLEGRPAALVYRNGEFDLVAADVPRS